MIDFNNIKQEVNTFKSRLLNNETIALASFPRSGNTWLRYLIEEATGEKSGSVYPADRVMPRPRDGIVIKTHELDLHRYDRAIHIVRNPFDAIASYFHWKIDIDGLQPDWSDHVICSVEQWKQHTSSWLGATFPVYRVKYEDLLKDSVGELDKVTTWLGYELSATELKSIVARSNLERMRKRSPGIGKKFFKQGKKGTGKRRFSQEQSGLVIAELSELLTILKYDNLL